MLGLILGLILPPGREAAAAAQPQELAPGLLILRAPLLLNKIIKLGALPKHNTCFPKIRDDHTRPWQVSGDAASSGEAFLAPAVGEVALGPTALTFVFFSVGHDMRTDQTGNEPEKAGIGKHRCLPMPLWRELPKVPVWEQPHPIPGEHFPPQRLYCPQKGLSCLQHGDETQFY